MPNLLVTGGAGFIGANFVRYWSEQHPSDEIVVLDALTYAGNRTNLDDVSGIEFVHADIRDHDVVVDLLRTRRIGTIVHLAAETHVDRSIHDPDAFIETNVVGTHALLKAAKAAWLDQGSGREHRFHHVSTDEVYGTLGPDDPPFSECTPHAPNSPYAASKSASDQFVRAYHRTYSLQTTTSNCSNNYGPYQFPEKLIPLLIINALHGKALPIYGDGQHVRDWLHVEDHCRAIELILENGQVGAVYNIGGAAELSNNAVADKLCNAIDNAFADNGSLVRRFPDAPAAAGRPSSCLKSHVADRPGHDRRYAIDGTRIRTELGYRPRHSFETGLDETLAWYLTNERWWQAVLDGSYRAWIERHYAARGAA